MRRILFTLLFIALSLYACNWTPAPAEAQGTMWVEVLNSHVELTRAQDDGCVFGENTRTVYLNRPGECGRPADVTNVFMIYGHNFWVDKVMAHYSRDGVGVGVWPALHAAGNGLPADTVRLFDGKRLWRGTVIEVIHEAQKYGLQPQSEFPCPTGVCGTLTTCADLKPGWTLVRVAYR